MARELGAGPLVKIAARSSGRASHYVKEKSTVFELWFKREGLEWYQQAEYYGIKGVRTSLRINVCTGEVLGNPLVCVEAPEAFKGATMTLNGDDFWSLSSGQGLASLCGGTTLSPGQHQIVLTLEDQRTVIKRFVYEPSSYWPDQEIRLIIADDEAPALP